MRRPVFLALLGATLLTASAAAAQASDPLRALRPDPQDSVHVDAFLGVDYTILNRNASAHEVRGFSLQPYLLKTADFSVSNLSRFDFGLNAAATSLLAIGGFAKPDDTPTSDSDAAEAERYAGMIAYRFGGFKIRTEVGFARMATYLTPGAQNGTAYPLTTYYAPSSGPLRHLVPGDGVGGNTDWTEAAIDAVIPWDALGGDILFGYRYTQLDSLSAYTFSSDFQAVVPDQFVCHSAEVMQTAGRTLFPHVSTQGDLFFGVGYGQTTSTLVNPASALCLAYGFDLKTSYRDGPFDASIGINIHQFGGFPVGGGDTLQKAAGYNLVSSGRYEPAPAGSRWSIDGPVENNYVFGLSFHLAAHF